VLPSILRSIDQLSDYYTNIDAGKFNLFMGTPETSIPTAAEISGFGGCGIASLAERGSNDRLYFPPL